MFLGFGSKVLGTKSQCSDEQQSIVPFRSWLGGLRLLVQVLPRETSPTGSMRPRSGSVP
jgi:hypothetical protein